MKAITNWRYYVMAVLFTVGFICIAGAFEVDEKLPMAEWTTLTLLLAAIGFGSFILLGKLTNRWEANNEIPEFTNQCKEYD